MRPGVCWGMALWVGCGGGQQTPVGATLDDGQVLIGKVRTSALTLTGSFGDVDVPLSDVGMVLPVEGRTLKDSGRNVTVWLRNGSELKGEWSEPELSMALPMGGHEIDVGLEVDRLQALQLQGSEHWPEDGLYRVRTTWNDDFLVDPKATRVVVSNELGRFDPFLSECRAVGPISDPTGDWRVELVTGTVLIGPLDTEEITFALPMGPDEIVVPLEALAALERGVWTQHGPKEGGGVFSPVEEVMQVPNRRPRPAPSAAKPGLSSSQGWFDNTELEASKY
ncbi:MAG: hypothetical protein KTR31_09225 [Myxococcales bacterium]|nr:hypothetical protein [Myxococcales bacterium]